MPAAPRLELDAYVVDVLLPDLVGHDRSPSSFLVYVFLARQADGRRAAEASLRAIAEGTGLSKRAVQTAVANLERRKLVGVERRGPTAVPIYTVLRPWVRK